MAFLFSGHGAQAFHMGRALFESCAEFRGEMAAMDRELLRRTGRSVLARLYDDARAKADPFDDFAFSHPAIFMVELALGRILRDRYGSPDCVVGASLGELVAAVMAEAVSFETALELILHHVEVFGGRDACGGMLAILAPPSLYEQWPEIASCAALAGNADDSHFVVAGRLDELDRLESFLQRKGVDFLRLPVRYPFHSDRIEPFKAEVLRCTDWLARPPCVPVISCASRDFLRGYSRDHMWRSIREPMDIAGALDLLEDGGAWTCADLSPGSVFAAALRRRKRTRPNRIFGVLTPYGSELANFNKVCDALDARIAQEAWP